MPGMLCSVCSVRVSTFCPPGSGCPPSSGRASGPSGSPPRMRCPRAAPRPPAAMLCCGPPRESRMAGSFVHLHAHSSYSLSEGAIKADKLATLAKDAGMPAVALTDSANLFGGPGIRARLRRQGHPADHGLPAIPLPHRQRRPPRSRTPAARPDRRPGDGCARPRQPAAPLIAQLPGQRRLRPALPEAADAGGTCGRPLPAHRRHLRPDRPAAGRGAPGPGRGAAAAPGRRLPRPPRGRAEPSWPGCRTGDRAADAGAGRRARPADRRRQRCLLRHAGDA